MPIPILQQEESRVASSPCVWPFVFEFDWCGEWQAVGTGKEAPAS